MISTTEQTNTFIGGMNMDTDVSLIPNNQYRYAENIRVITNDNGTTGAIQNIEGVYKYGIEIPHDESDDPGDNETDQDRVIIGSISLDELEYDTMIPSFNMPVYRYAYNCYVKSWDDFVESPEDYRTGFMSSISNDRISDDTVIAKTILVAPYEYGAENIKRGYTYLIECNMFAPGARLLLIFMPTPSSRVAKCQITNGQTFTIDDMISLNDSIITDQFSYREIQICSPYGDNHISDSNFYAIKVNVLRDSETFSNMYHIFNRYNCNSINQNPNDVAPIFKMTAYHSGGNGGSNVPSTSGNETIIGTTTINNIAVVVTRMNNGYNRVYRVTDFDSKDPQQKIILQGNLKLCQDLSKTPRISIVGNYESDSNIKVYFTDGNSAIKLLNVVDDRYSFGSDLVDSNGNILNPLAVDITPGATLPPFKITNLTVGNLPSGVVQYCYQLFNLHSSETTLSPLSEAVHLTQSSTNQDSQSYMGSYPNTSSGKACVIEAPLITKDFQKCRIISIRYTSNNSIPKIIVVDEIDVMSAYDKIKYVDTGNSYMGEISVDEFNMLTGYQFTATTITKMQNRLFAANITEDTWNPGFYDARAYRCNINGQVVLESASSTNSITINDMDNADLSTIPREHDCINPYNNILFSSSSENQQYIYGKSVGTYRPMGGYGINIEYHFTTATIDLVDKNSSSRIPDNCSMNANAKYMDKITITNVGYGTSIQQNLDTETQNRIPNYADPYIAANYKGYQRDEIYRFGIIFYNDKGIPSPVYWIGDIKMPHVGQVPAFTSNGGDIQGQILGIKFTVKNVPVGAIAYEIVRCDRTESDRSVIMQCIATNLYEYRVQEKEHVGKGSVVSSSLELRPYIMPNFIIGDITTGNFRLDGSAGRTDTLNGSLLVKDYVRIISPEICIQKDNIEKYLKDTTYLDYLCTYASPINTSGAPSGATRVTTAASKVLQYDGSIATINTTNNYVKSLNGKVAVALQYITDDNEEGYYNANVCKYYRAVNYQTPNGQQPSYIIDAKYPLDIPYNAFQDVSAYKINVGERTYTNYATTCLDEPNGFVSVGAAGPCVVAQVSGLMNRFNNISGTNLTSLDVVNAIPVFNIKRAVASAYGGNTYVSRQNSIYISTNSYVKINSNSAEPTITYTHGGDTFLNLLDYPCTFTFQGDDEKTWNNCKRFIAAYIPFESSINMNLFNGDMAHRTYASNNYIDSHLQLDITQKGNYHVQDRPYFVYNPVYSSQSGSRKFVPNSIYAKDDTKVYNRIIVSQAKISNEILDNWTMFKVADYLDVDNQYGDITNLKVFKDRLFYWQNTALGIAAVNERALIADDNVGQLTLGTGGILSRFDYITTLNGSSIANDKSIVNSDNVLYWYDFDKNEICSYTGQIAQLSKEKQVQTYLNEKPSDERNDVLGLFDKKYNEVWFKFDDKSLIFNEQLGRFTSFYTFNPEWSLQFSDKIITLKDNMYYLINDLDTSNLDVVSKNAIIELVVNKDPLYTKTFDNVRFSGNFIDATGSEVTQNIIERLKFNTKEQTATINDNVPIDYREETFRFPVPRQSNFNDNILSFPARMRGKYMTCQYNFTADDGNQFKVPYITTTYRYSLI